MQNDLSLSLCLSCKLLVLPIILHLYTHNQNNSTPYATCNMLLLVLLPFVLRECQCTHGSCLTGSDQCFCSDSDLGHWGGPTCNDCEAGYAGVTCKTPCEGGPCNPCNGHGTCSAGFSGTGKCTCFNNATHGRWDGDACDHCQPNYYGADCTFLCTTTDSCNGHGACNEGRGGNGECVCHQGWDLQTACSECLPSRWGDCKQACRGVVVVQGKELPCNGHGTCSHGTNGTGECTSCEPEWAGQDCRTPCMCLPQHGSCDADTTGDGSCVCKEHRVPPDCALCEPGYGGADCSSTCPGTPPCSNKGVCESATATCSCYDGYAGTECEVACPGTPPCNNNGKCEAGTPAGTYQCVCHTDSSRGYWAGSDCSVCADGYSGHTTVALCALQCPSSGLGLCSGRGTCVDGACACLRRWDPPALLDYCGVSCDVEDDTTTDAKECGTDVCDRGYYGAQCLSTCPGFAAGVPCSGHGNCDLEGTCHCDAPTSTSQWGGPACDVACPTDASNRPCGYPAHGFCQKDGTCACRKGYDGPTCSLECPVLAGMICNNHGDCVLGSCECTNGWHGATCESLCVCPVHSTCVAGGGCTCNDGFTGSTCTDCEAGLHGPLCTEICAGTTVGKTCRCATNMAGENCDISCPQFGGLVCNAKGTCRDGVAGDGGCTCEAGYYGEHCTVQCDAKVCALTYRLTHPACNTDTGRCECEPQWGGPLCDTCSAAFWGENCDAACLCNAHGVCDRATGVCVCYSSSDEGHFTGTTCDTCSPGYVGVECKAPRVCTTQGDSLTPLNIDPVSLSRTPMTTFPPYGLWVDTRAGGGYAYVGGNPLIAWSTQRPQDASQSEVNTTLSGVLRDMFGSDSALYLVFAPGRQAATQLATLSPIPRPPSFGMGRPFADPVVQSLSERVADSVTHYASEGSSAIFHTDGEGTTKLLHMTVPGCAGSDTSQCPSASVAVPPDTQVVAAGPRYVFLGGRTILGWKVQRVEWSTAGGAWLGTLSEMIIPSAVDAASVRFMRASGTHSVVVVVDSADSRVAIVRLSTADTAAAEASTTSWVRLPDGVSATALAVDDLLEAAFIGGLEVKSAQPGKLYKVSVSEGLPVVVYDVVSLSHTTVKGKLVAEVVASLYVDQSTRTLYAGVSLDSSVTILSFLLWEVGSIERPESPIYPPVIASDGGTPVIVRGKGFAKLNLGDYIPGAYLRVRGAVDCLWGGLQNATRGEVLNSSAIQCEAPTAVEECGEEAIEIGLDGHRHTGCANTVVRVPPWTVKSISPARGMNTGGTVVTVHGNGFVDSPQLLCRFSLGCDTPESQITPTCGILCSGDNAEEPVVAGNFISSNEVLCVQPASQGIGLAYLDVSVDGCKPANNHPFHFTVTGVPVGLSILNFAPGELAPLLLQYEPELSVPRMDVAVVDAANTSLVAADDSALVASNRPVTIALLPAQGVAQRDQQTKFVGQSGTPGVASFEDVQLVFDKTYEGDQHIILRVEAPLDRWFVDIPVLVMPGAPHAVFLTGQPSAVSEHNRVGSVMRALKTQPIVMLTDSYGNKITSPDRQYTVQCSVVDETAEAYARDDPDTTYVSVVQNKQPSCEVTETNPECTFDGVSITTLFGASYRLRFEADGLISVDSNPIVAELCATWQYQRVSDPPAFADCELCPKGALCNGSAVMMARPGYWRTSNASLEFQGCLGGESVCIGGSQMGECAGAYTGPLCATCAEGYTAFILTTCSSCLPWLHAVLFFLIVVGIVAAVTTVAVLADSTTEAGAITMSETSAARMRIIVGHMQRCSLLGGVFFTAWGGELTFLFYAFTAPFGQIGLDCWTRGLGLSQRSKFVGYCVALILVSFLSAALALVWSRYFRGSSGDRLEKRRGRRKRLMMSSMLCRTAPLTLFVLYMETLRHACMLMRCKDVGDIHGKRLVYDIHTSCSEADYKSYLSGSIVVVLVLTAVLPLSIVLSDELIQRVENVTASSASFTKTQSQRQNTSKVLVSSLVAFFSVFTSGFIPSHRHWEAVVMVEKALLCIVIYVAAAGYPEAQLNLAGWVAVCGLLASLSAQPYTDPANNTLQATSRMVFLLTVYCLHILHSSELTAFEDGGIRALIVASQLLFSGVALAVLYAEMAGKVDENATKGGLTGELLSLILRRRGDFGTCKLDTDALLAQAVPLIPEEEKPMDQLLTTSDSRLEVPLSQPEPDLENATRVESQVGSSLDITDSTHEETPTPLPPQRGLLGSPPGTALGSGLGSPLGGLVAAPKRDVTDAALLALLGDCGDGGDSRCAYCGMSFSEAMNVPGACAASPLTAKRHLAALPGEENILL